MSAFVVFLGGDSLPWLELEDGGVIGRGEDFREAGVTVTAIAPASSVTFRAATFGGVSPAQALAAARLDASEVSLGSDRHVAVAEAGDHYVMTDTATMQRWLSELAERGLAASAIIPAPDLLPVPQDGFLRAVLHDETILRSADTGLEDDGVVSALVVGDAEVRTLEPAELEQAIASAVQTPPLNMLQGDFAPRADWSAPEGYWRRLAMYAVVAAAILLAIPIAQWTRLSVATSSTNEQSATISALVLGERSGSEDAIDRLQDKVAELRGGGAGFLPTLGALMTSMETMPNVELGQLSFDPDGTLHATVRASAQPEIDMLARGMESHAFTVSKGAPRTEQGRIEVDMQVRPK